MSEIFHPPMGLTRATKVRYCRSIKAVPHRTKGKTMAATNLEKKAPPTDTTVLGRHYLLAPTEELEKAVRNLQFEIDLRHQREHVSQAAKEVSAARRAEIEEALRGAEVYDVEADGGL